MGWSDPGPKPRDSNAIVGDLEKLIATSGERGPFILMGHSMAGLHTRLFAARNPDKIAGLVLIEATTPEQIGSPQTTKFLSAFTSISKVAAVSARKFRDLTTPLYSKYGDRIGLPAQGSAEKRRAYVSGRHARTAADEVANWPRSAAEEPGLAPPTTTLRWPVAVIVAGARRAGARNGTTCGALRAVGLAGPGAISRRSRRPRTPRSWAKPMATRRCVASSTCWPTWRR